MSARRFFLWRGVKAMKLIKPLKTFAAGTKLYMPNRKEAYEVEDEQAKSWEASGHCEVIEPIDEGTKDNPSDELENEELDTTTKQEAADIEPQEDEGANTPNETETAENEPETNDFDAMEYKDLKAAAKEAEIKNYHTMKKPDLIAALKGE